MNNVFNYFFYCIAFSYSYIKFGVFKFIFKFGDYLDYLEVKRFCLWHEVAALDSKFSGVLKTDNREGGLSHHKWGIRQIYSKVSLRSPNFPMVRGFTWGRGTSVDSLEARLVQSDHYFSLERQIEFTQFHVYGWKRLRYRLRKIRLSWLNNEAYILGIDNRSNVIYSPNKPIISALFSIFFILFFVPFFIFDIFWLNIVYYFISFCNNISSFVYSYGESFINGRITSIIYFSICRFFFTVLRPFYYVFYIFMSFWWFFWYIFQDIGLIIYVVGSKKIFKLSYFILRCFYRVAYKTVSSPITYFYLVVTWVYRIISSFFSRVLNPALCLLFRRSIILKFVFRIIVSLFYIYVFFGYLVTFFFFTVPLLWLFTSIIFDIFCKGYGVIFSPACVFFVFIPSFGLLVPYFRKFMKLHKFVITGYYRMDYAQRKFISEINSYYYRTAFRINESRNYEKWALGREVSSLRNMVEDTHVAYHKPDPYVVTVKKDFSFLGSVLGGKDQTVANKTFHLNKHIQIARLDQSLEQKRVKISSEARHSTSKYYKSARYADKFRFNVNEFKFNRFANNRFYYSVYDTQFNSLGIIDWFFNYWANNPIKVFPQLSGSINIMRESYHAIDPNIYFLSPTIFNFVSSSLYSSKGFEFPKISRLYRYYTFNKSSRYVLGSDRVFWDSFSRPYLEMMGSYANSEFSFNWLGTADSRPSSFDWLRSFNPLPRVMANHRFMFDFKPASDDQTFQEELYKNLESDRNNFIGSSIYIQSLYDYYYIFRLNTYAYLSFSFVSDFCFTKVLFPSWLFKNFYFGSFGYPNYGSEFINLLDHSLFFSYYNKSRSFAYYFDSISSNVVKEYYYSMFMSFYRSVSRSGGFIDRSEPSTYPYEFYYWVRNPKLTSSTRFKDSINEELEKYLYHETNTLNAFTYGLFKGVHSGMNYRAQSSYLAYMMRSTELGMRQYVVKRKETYQSVVEDVYNLFFNVLLGETPKDQKYARSFAHIDVTDEITAEQVKSAKQAQNTRIGFANFPVVYAHMIMELFSMFLCVSYLFLIGNRPIDIYFWYIYLDFFTIWVTRFLEFLNVNPSFFWYFLCFLLGAPFLFNSFV